MPKNDLVSNPSATTDAVDSSKDNQGTPGNPGDPKNPANAPHLALVIDDEARQAADAELQGLLRKDTSEMSATDKKAHDRRVWELHYAANGETPPKR